MQTTKGKLPLQDGYPRQNSKVALSVLGKVGFRLFEIPTRSAEVNPIENNFHLVRKKFSEYTLQQFQKKHLDSFQVV